MEARIEYRGTGRALAGELFIAAILFALTLGFSLPWIVVRVLKTLLARTTIRTLGEDIALRFRGRGTALAMIILRGALFTTITLGVYGPWFAVEVYEWFLDHAHAREYRSSSELSGGELFVATFGGFVLTAITLGVYAPWFACTVARVLARRTMILEHEQVIGTCAFTGDGRALIAAIFSGRLVAFAVENTELLIRGQTFRGESSPSQIVRYRAAKSARVAALVPRMALVPRAAARA